MIKLIIDNRTNNEFKYEKIFEEIIAYVAKYFKIDGSVEVGLIILSKDKMQEINKEYRGKDTHTDVLSFPQEDMNWLKQTLNFYLMGDIYMSWEKIEEQANEFNHSSKREWSYLFTHSLLHLFGLDHKKVKEEKNMNKIAYKVMEHINVKR